MELFIWKESLTVVRSFFRLRTFDSLRIRDFRFLWATMWCTNSSQWIENVAIGWLTFQVTQSALLTTFSVGAGAIPYLVVGPVGGVLIDAWDRRKLFLPALALSFIATTIFAAVVLLDLVRTWHIFAFMLVSGSLRTFRYGVEAALVSNIVPRDRLINGFALNTFTGSATRASVPAITGLLVALIDVGFTLVVSVLLAGFALLVAFPIGSRPQMKHSVSLTTIVRDIAEGAQYLKKTPKVIVLTILTVIPILLIAPINIGLMPVYTQEVFKSGPEALGLLITAIGIGMSIATIVLASVGEILYKARAMVLSLIGTALGVLIFSQISVLPIAFIVAMGYSTVLMMVYVIHSGAIQEVIPDQVRGRVTTLLSAGFITFPVGTLLVGSLAQEFGARTAVVVAACAMLAVVMVFVACYRRVLTMT